MSLLALLEDRAASYDFAAEVIGRIIPRRYSWHTLRMAATEATAAVRGRCKAYEPLGLALEIVAKAVDDGAEAETWGATEEELAELFEKRAAECRDRANHDRFMRSICRWAQST